MKMYTNCGFLDLRVRGFVFHYRLDLGYVEFRIMHYFP